MKTITLQDYKQRILRVLVRIQQQMDACATVDDNFAPQGEIGVQSISGGEYAVATHFGPYDTLGETYARLMGQWLPRSGREMRSTPCFEVYLNDPNSTAPEDLLTDIHVPLEPTH